MSDVNAEQNQGASQDSAAPESTTGELERIRAEIKAEFDAKIKAEINGLNRKNSELSKELEKERLSKLSEEERAKKEAEILKSEAENARKESENYKRALIIDKSLNEAGLPIELANRIIGGTEEEIKNDVKFLKDFISAEIKKGVAGEVNQKLSGASPQGGTVAGDVSVQAQYDAAKKAGDYALVTAIQRNARATGVQLKL